MFEWAVLEINQKYYQLFSSLASFHDVWQQYAPRMKERAFFFTTLDESYSVLLLRISEDSVADTHISVSSEQIQALMHMIKLDFEAQKFIAST